MKNLKISSIAFVIISLIGFSSCEKYLEFDTDDKTSKLVVNSLMDGDSLFSVNVSHSLNILDDGTLNQIESASVKILDANDNLVETLTHTTNGTYIGATKPTPGTTYKVNVSASNYATVTATDKLPTTINILSADTLGIVDANGDSVLQITIKFQDIGGVTNRYMLELFTADIISGTIYINPATFNSNDVSLSGNGIGGDSEASYSQAVFTDNLFDGTIKTLIITTEDTRLYDSFLQITLSNISDPWYEYRRTVNRHLANQGNPFAQPVIVYNNIENGFGIFGARMITRKKISY